MIFKITPTCKVCGCFLMMLLAVTLGASNNDRTYALNELIELGLTNSYGTRTEELQKEITRSSLRSSYYDFLPSASASISYQYPDTDNQAIGFNINKGIALNEPTYFNWRRANIDWDNARLSYVQNRREIIYEIFARFVRVVEAQKRVEIQEKNLSIQQRITDQIELLHRLEQRSIIDSKQSQISLINAQIALEDAVVQLQNARENLFLYINIEDEGYALEEIKIPLSDDLPEYQIPVEVILAENNLKKTSLSLFQSKLDFFPRLNLSYTYSNSRRFRMEDSPFGVDDYRDSYTIALSASYPLFNLLQHRENHHRNLRNMKIQELSFDNLVNNRRTYYEQLLRDWDREKRMSGLAEIKNELAAETLELAQSRFNLGVLSLLELEQAMKDYYESNIEVSTRYYQKLLKQEELHLFLSEPILGIW